jgi:dTMP kinase
MDNQSNPSSAPFITFEGCECSGKSTQSRLLYDWLVSTGKQAILTKEPGGTKTADELRQFLLNKEKKLDVRSEALLHIAARIEHVTDVILPSTKLGTTVICDRFADSTLAYQGYGHGMSIDFLKSLHKTLLNDLQPSITFILDIDLDTFKARLKTKHEGSNNNDRYETLPEAFHMKVMNGFREIAKQNPTRCILIDARNKSIEGIHQEILGHTTLSSLRGA